MYCLSDSLSIKSIGQGAQSLYMYSNIRAKYVKLRGQEAIIHGNCNIQQCYVETSLAVIVY